jgi:hypothetical protein
VGWTVLQIGREGQASVIVGRASPVRRSKSRSGCRGDLAAGAGSTELTRGSHASTLALTVSWPGDGRSPRPAGTSSRRVDSARGITSTNRSSGMRSRVRSALPGSRRARPATRLATRSDASHGVRSGHLTRPRVAGPQGREHDHDLHLRAESRPVGHPQSSGQLASRQDMNIRRLHANRRQARDDSRLRRRGQFGSPAYLRCTERAACGIA